MNIFQQFIESLYSPATIAKFRFQKIGKTILYVFVLMLLATIPPAIILGTSISSLYNTAEEHFTETFPDFAIQNGVLSSDAEEPIIIEEDGEVIVFDSTGEMKPSDLAEYDSAIALFEREATVIADGAARSVTYQELDINFTKDEVTGLLSSLGGILPLIIGIIMLVMYIFTTGMKFIGIFTLSLIALFIKRKTADQLNYRHCWILSAYTVTLPTMLFVVLDSLPIFIPFSFTIYWVIAISMLYFVFREIPRPRVSSEIPHESKLDQP